MWADKRSLALSLPDPAVNHTSVKRVEVSIYMSVKQRTDWLHTAAVNSREKKTEIAQKFTKMNKNKKS